MTYSFELPLLLPTLTAGGAIIARLVSAFPAGSLRFFLALIWPGWEPAERRVCRSRLGAPDLPRLLPLTPVRTAPADTRIRRPRPPVVAVFALPLLGLLLLYAANDLPGFGDPASPASIHVSPHYLENSLADTKTPNVVNSVLMDYRALDTLIETVVVFTSGVACWLLLRRDPE